MPPVLDEIGDWTNPPASSGVTLQPPDEQLRGFEHPDWTIGLSGCSIGWFEGSFPKPVICTTFDRVFHRVYRAYF